MADWLDDDYFPSYMVSVSLLLSVGILVIFWSISKYSTKIFTSPNFILIKNDRKREKEEELKLTVIRFIKM